MNGNARDLPIPPDSATNLHIGIASEFETALLARRSPNLRRFSIVGTDATVNAAATAVVLIDGMPGLQALLEDCGIASFEHVILNTIEATSSDPHDIARLLKRLLAAHGILTLIRGPEWNNMFSRLLIHEGLEVSSGIGTGPTPPCTSDRLLQASDSARMAESLPDLVVQRFTKFSPPSIDIAMTMLPPVGGVSDVRVIQPAAALSGSAEVRVQVHMHNDAVPELAGDQKIFIFHRPLLAGEWGLRQLGRLINDGWLVICEFDDNPKQMAILQAPDIHNFDGVHAVQTTTDALREVLSDYNSHVAIFPNFIAELPEPRNFQNEDELTLIYSGINRDDEWPPFLPVLNRVARRAGSRLQFRVIGDLKMYESLDTAHKQFVPMCDYETYLFHLAMAEIAFMPLADTPFNRCKSDLKFIEASVNRLVSVASTTVYQHTVRNYATGLLFDGPTQLERLLNDILHHPLAARRIANNARCYVHKRRLLAGSIRTRIDFYRDALLNRTALEAALLKRLPQMRRFLTK